jgi:hypothetical protein
VRCWCRPAVVRCCAARTTCRSCRSRNTTCGMSFRRAHRFAARVTSRRRAEALVRPGLRSTAGRVFPGLQAPRTLGELVHGDHHILPALPSIEPLPRQAEHSRYSYAGPLLAQDVFACSTSPPRQARTSRPSGSSSTPLTAVRRSTSRWAPWQPDGSDEYRRL